MHSGHENKSEVPELRGDILSMTPPGAVAITFNGKVTTIPDTAINRKIKISLNIGMSRKVTKNLNTGNRKIKTIPDTGISITVPTIPKYRHEQKGYKNPQYRHQQEAKMERIT